MSATGTPVPIARASEELPPAFAIMRQRLEDALRHPGHPGKDHPKAIVTYCLQLLGEKPFRNGSAALRNAHDQLKLFTGAPVCELLALSPTGLHAFLYPALEISWSQETAAPGLRSRWTPQKPWTGQQIATALVLEERIGGKLFVAKAAAPLYVWNLLEAKGRQQQADLTRPPHSEDIISGGFVEIVSREQIVQICPWAEQAAIQVSARFKEALLAYAFAAFTFVHRSSLSL